MPTVRFHAHCLDGSVSTALLMRARPEITDCIPYVHDAAGETPLVIENTIGVDIPFIHGMMEWYDHHPSGLRFLTGDALAARPIQCAMHFNPHASACASLLPRPPEFARLVDEVAVIDSGNFPNVHAACDFENPLLLAATTMKRLGDCDLDRVVAWALARTARDPIATLVDSIPAREQLHTIELARGHEALLRRTVEVHDRILFFDHTEHTDETDGLSPFLTYRTFPDAELVVYLQTFTDGHYVRLSRNPWKWNFPFPCRIDRIAERFGGGGHATNGSIRFPNTNDGLQSARQTASEIIALLPDASAHAHTHPTSREVG